VKNVANLLEATPALVIPYDLKSAMLAVNRGIPLLSCAPNAKATKEIRNFARSLIRRA
jgi:Flp pilus assembly CpaE family ATPase